MTDEKNIEAVVLGKSGYQYVSTYQEIVADTIERCAQVAENLMASDEYGLEVDMNYGEAIAAAIRALKPRID